jgi:tryptophanyl-tRNA synthetase
VALYRLFAQEDEVAKLASLYRNPLEDADRREGRCFGYGDSKKMLLEKMNAYFEPFREKRKELSGAARLRRGSAAATVRPEHGPKRRKRWTWFAKQCGLRPT